MMEPLLANLKQSVAISMRNKLSYFASQSTADAKAPASSPGSLALPAPKRGEEPGNEVG